MARGSNIRLVTDCDRDDWQVNVEMRKVAVIRIQVLLSKGESQIYVEKSRYLRFGMQYTR